MDPVTQAVLFSWNFDPWAVVPVFFGAVIYLRGWWLLSTKPSRRFGVAQLVAFQSGMAAILLALTSPIDTFASLLLFVHMIQHILLTMIAPPLILLGAPMLPLLRGIPRLVMTSTVGTLLRVGVVRSLGSFLVRPVVALVLFGITTVFWHVPVMYELALRSEFWHQIEHICFFFTGLFFWWSVVQPWPSRPYWSGWAMILYLLGADLTNTAVSAVLCFAERVLYPAYAVAPNLWGISPLSDQALAGAVMWVAGSLAFLLPVGWILTRLLEPSLVAPPRRQKSASSASGKFMASLLIIFCQLAPPEPILAHHGGVVHFREAGGALIITLFSENEPVNTGTVELSVLVQNKVGEPVLDADVVLELANADARQQRVQAIAKRSQSPNRLMYAANVTLPDPGVWRVNVSVRRAGATVKTRGELVVQKATRYAPGWLYFLVFVGLSGAVWLVTRKRHARTEKSAARDTADS